MAGPDCTPHPVEAGTPVPRGVMEETEDRLAQAGADGVKWAAEFQATARKLGYPEMDEGWLRAWFCNAIMAGYDEARRKYEPVP